MACSSGELHAICFLWAHVFYVMAEDTFIDDRNDFRWKDVLSTGLRVFIAGIDGATGVAQVSGGGGTSNDMPWRDKDEDYLDWARRAMRYAHANIIQAIGSNSR